MDLVVLLQHVEGEPGDLWKWGKHGWSDGDRNDGGEIFFLGLEPLISFNQSA